MPALKRRSWMSFIFGSSCTEKGGESNGAESRPMQATKRKG